MSSLFSDGDSVRRFIQSKLHSRGIFWEYVSKCCGGWDFDILCSDVIAVARQDPSKAASLISFHIPGLKLGASEIAEFASLFPREGTDSHRQAATVRVHKQKAIRLAPQFRAGQNLRRLRTAMGYSRQESASAMSCSVRDIEILESPSNDLTKRLVLFLRFCKAHSVDMHTILGRPQCSPDNNNLFTSGLANDPNARNLRSLEQKMLSDLVVLRPNAVLNDFVKVQKVLEHRYCRWLREGLVARQYRRSQDFQFSEFEIEDALKNTQ